MKGWKTLLVAAVLAIAGALQGLNWADLIPNNPTTVGWIVTGIGVVMAVLRSMTSTPLGSKS